MVLVVTDNVGTRCHEIPNKNHTPMRPTNEVSRYVYYSNEWPVGGVC